MRYLLSNGRSFTLRPVTGAEVLHVQQTAHRVPLLSVQTRLMLRSVTHLDDEPVFYPLLEWREMSETVREMMTAAWIKENITCAEL